MKILAPSQLVKSLAVLAESQKHFSLLWKLSVARVGEKRCQVALKASDKKRSIEAQKNSAGRIEMHQAATNLSPYMMVWSTTWNTHWNKPLTRVRWCKRKHSFPQMKTTKYVLDGMWVSAGWDTTPWAAMPGRGVGNPVRDDRNATATAPQLCRESRRGDAKKRWGACVRVTFSLLSPVSGPAPTVAPPSLPRLEHSQHLYLRLRGNCHFDTTDNSTS